MRACSVILRAAAPLVSAALLAAAMGCTGPLRPSVAALGDAQAPRPGAQLRLWPSGTEEKPGTAQQTGRAWSPFRQAALKWMGETKLVPWSQHLISQQRAAQLGPRLLPGDILLTRREWRLSGIGMPGYWSHSALYVGTPESRRTFFGREGAWAQDGFEAWLQERCPDAYDVMLAKTASGIRPEVVEALSVGVVLNDISVAAHADSVAVLRPRLPRSEIARALALALSMTGRPYDYDFDFESDYAMICSELICRAYAPGPGMTGLRFPSTSRYGRRLTVANDMAQLFATEFGSPAAQLDLVAFLDGDRSTGQILELGAAEFRTSWQRPKWYALAQSF